MFKIILLCSLISFVFGSAIDSTNNKNIEEHDLTLESIKELLKTEPKIELIGTKTVNGIPRNVLNYKFGNRVLGDRKVFEKSDTHSLGTPQNVKLPIEWNGRWNQKVTFIEIQVDQSSSFGDAYVVRGNIGESSITVEVKADFTTYFSYAYHLFAVDA